MCCCVKSSNPTIAFVCTSPMGILAYVVAGLCVQQGYDSSVCLSFSLHLSVPQTSAAVCCLLCVPNPARHDADAQGLSVGQLMCNPHLPLVWEGVSQALCVCSMHCVCRPVKWPFVRAVLMCVRICGPVYMWLCAPYPQQILPVSPTTYTNPIWTCVVCTGVHRGEEWGVYCGCRGYVV
jgi:hypothetical protein